MLAVGLSSLNDFEDGTTQAWSEGFRSPNPPTNVSSGGPSGVGDNYVRNVSTGGNGPGGRWVMFNTSSTWTGDYVAASVTRITAQMSNTGPASVPMGIALGTLNVSSGNWWATASPVSIPNDGAWHSVEFGLDAASLTQVQGSASLNTVLSGAGVLRFVANATPSHVGSTSLSGTTIGVDNIRAAGPAAPEVTLSINNTNIPENAGTATITATLSTTSSQPVTVDLGYTGTATNGTDYTPSSSQITIAAGSTSGTATVLAVDDTLDENDETVIVDITSVTNATEAGTQQVTTTILDNDAAPTVTLAVDNATITEASTFLLNGNAGLGLLAGNENPAKTGGSGGIGPGGISLDAATNTLSIDVRWGSGNGFTDLTGIATAMHIHGPTADPTPTGLGQNASVLVGLSGLTGFNNSASNGGFIGTVVLSDAEEAAILSNQTYINVHTAANGPGEIRGNLVAGSLATLTATLSAATSFPVTVDLGYTGTATSGTDYTPSSSQITIAAGNLSGTATVLAVDDTLDENDETIIADITNVTNATEAGTQQVITTIVDDDAPPSVTESGVNGIGNNNRSQIESVVLQFDRPVTVNSVSSLRIVNHTTRSPVDISSGTLQNNGTAEVTWNLADVSLADGFYTAELLRTEAVSSQGKPLTATHAILFHRLPGDSNGSAQVDASDFDDLKASFNTVGGPILGPGDLDGNGDVNFSDFGILATNFEKMLAALELDFGDAPELGTSFPTRLPNGARHVLGSGLRLGASVDGEANGQPDATAAGDGADEDGVTFGTLQAGNANASVTVNANVPSGTAMLNAWVDFNADGDWGDLGEQVFVDQALISGPNNLSISIPAGATAGSTFARFRMTGTPGYSFFGLAPDGEVEDYQVTLVAAVGGTSSRQLVSAGWFAERAAADQLSAGLSSEAKITDVELQPTSGIMDIRVIDRAIEQVAANGLRTPQTGEDFESLEEHLIDQVFEQGDLLKDSIF